MQKGETTRRGSGESYPNGNRLMKEIDAYPGRLFEGALRRSTKKARGFSVYK